MGGTDGQPVFERWDGHRAAGPRPELSVGLRSLPTYKKLVFMQRGLTGTVLQMLKC